MESKLCKCGKERRPKQRTCLECHAAYVREWRKTHKMTPIQRFKHNARTYLRVYIKRGLITKQPCEVCYDEKVEAHHENYSKPLDVHWLCFKHHRKHHQEVKVTL